MRITLQYFDDCPNWRVAEAHLGLALGEVPWLGVVVEYEIVDSPDKAQECGFHGSPTILLDGVDPFADENTTVGLTCRRFRTDDGFAGAPSVVQIVSVLREAAGRG